jgi:hypothetical protein
VISLDKNEPKILSLTNSERLDLRQRALELAIKSYPEGEHGSNIRKRAEKFLNFLITGVAND